MNMQRFFTFILIAYTAACLGGLIAFVHYVNKFNEAEQRCRYKGDTYIFHDGVCVHKKERP